MTPLTSILSFSLNEHTYPVIAALNKKYSVLSLFLQSWDSSKDINEDFLPELNSVLMQETSYAEVSAGEGYSAVAAIYPDEVKIHTKPDEEPVIISIELFKMCITDWLDFLQSHGR
ncbi:hypothetical protein LVD17_08935 [Fulvivirga ulvae]|uniref:hypothetical protein n=1 Tax=Fulvivirga ulvae TaxID=2904245 RepID=UPI001F44573F|nr:hypothetical protein [Fulvivirga ulvae]UII33938.1 hypothetical protein LVD17_08935 [Fulvivirga ulvae]